MVSQSLAAFQTSQANHWQKEYVDHLTHRIDQTIEYINTRPKSQIYDHIRSFMTLLDAAHQYPTLDQKLSSLFHVLHPLPLRWGLGNQWKTYIRFALQFSQTAQERMLLLNDLAELQFGLGELTSAIEYATQSLKIDKTNHTQNARAIYVLINCYRNLAQPEKADEIFKQWSDHFDIPTSEVTIPKDHTEGWLRFNRYQLELLREQGKVEEATDLIEKMIEINEKNQIADIELTANLYTRRSTLRWVKAQYHQAVADVLQAINLYHQIDDIFNAKSLQSNLGLIYWTMGELDLAETALNTAISFYKEIGAKQLITYDIGNLGLVYFSRGNLKQARELTEQQIEHASQISFLSEYYRGRTNLADILYYFGDYEKAIEEHQIVDEYYSSRGSREGYGLGLVWVACCEYKLGRTEKALHSLRNLLIYCDEHNSEVLEALTHRCLAQFLPFNERGVHLQASLGLAKKQGRKLEEAACLLAMAQILESDSEKQKAWEDGSAILQKIGAASWLEGHSIDNPPFIPMFV